MTAKPPDDDDANSPASQSLARGQKRSSLAGRSFESILLPWFLLSICQSIQSQPTRSLFFLNPYLRKKTLAFPSARVYHSRRSYHHAANTDNKNWLPTNGQFFHRR